MSKRRRTAPAEAPARERESPAHDRSRSHGRPGRILPQLGLLAAVFAVTVGVAELAGAANLGVSFGIGQIAFTIVLLALLIRA
jgi:hypothetical protein